MSYDRYLGEADPDHAETSTTRQTSIELRDRAIVALRTEGPTTPAFLAQRLGVTRQRMSCCLNDWRSYFQCDRDYRGQVKLADIHPHLMQGVCA